MPTNETFVDPSETTVTEEVTPPSADTEQPSTETTEPTASEKALKEELAAAKIETDRWKGRVEKLTKEEKKTKKDTAVTSSDLENLEWKLANKARIELVKEEFEKIQVDGYQGEKVSDRIALELAEKQAKIDTVGAKRDRQNDMSTPSVTNRTVDPKGYESETDRVLGLTIEKKRKLKAKHPHLDQD